jgi:uncharacterized protein YbdZ (MbtH family)
MATNESDTEDTTSYKVVINDEEQYSIWPADRENALGWTDAGSAGPKAECLAYIKEVWVDMRPLSLRKQMAEAAEQAARTPIDDRTTVDGPPEKDDLIQRLSELGQPLEVSLKSDSSVRAFRERIDKGYVHIRFTGTNGGTELGFKLDADALNVGQADFENRTGNVHLEGGLTLNYQKVRCIADINLETLAGTGHLRAVDV